MVKKKNNDVFMDDYERELDKSLSSGEWKSSKNKKRIMAESVVAAKSFFNKDARVNIRISSHDLTRLKYKAMEEGLPYQTLISSILHKYAAGNLNAN